MEEAQVTPCQIFEGARTGQGYGNIRIDGSNYTAHRIAYALHYGEDPGPFFVRHKCDNPPCVNPEHLELGTPRDNSGDMVRRGRSAKGMRNGMAKIDDKAAEMIVSLKGRLSTRKVALLVGLSNTQVWRIMNGNRRGY